MPKLLDIQRHLQKLRDLLPTDREVLAQYLVTLDTLIEETLGALNVRTARFAPRQLPSGELERGFVVLNNQVVRVEVVVRRIMKSPAPAPGGELEEKL